MTEQPEQSNPAMTRREADMAIAHQRQPGVSWLAFKAGFFGALGVALASLIVGIVVGIFWLVVFGAILGAALSN